MTGYSASVALVAAVRAHPHAQSWLANPSVDAGLISFVTSITVGLIAFLTSSRSTARTLKAARVSQNWGKDAEAYELATAELVRMQNARLCIQFSTKDLDEGKVAAYLAHRESDGWVNAQKMLLNYAPQPVLDALSEFEGCCVRIAQLFDQTRPLKAPPGDEDDDVREYRQAQVLDLFRQMLDAAVETDLKYQALVNAMRVQQGREPVRLNLPTYPELPRRRRIFFRN